MIERKISIDTAPDTRDLITLAYLKQQLALGDSNDALYNALIAEASSAISAHLNQYDDDSGDYTVCRHTVIETQFLENQVEGIYLGRWPIGEVEYVKEDGVQIDRQIDDPDNPGTSIDNPAWPYEVLKSEGTIIKIQSFCKVPFWSSRVEIKYTCGWISPADSSVVADPPTLSSTLPEIISQACAKLIKHQVLALQDGNEDITTEIKSEQIEGVGRVEYAVAPRSVNSSNMTLGGGLPIDVANMIQRYVTPGVT
jgi:hypothetical protein